MTQIRELLSSNRQRILPILLALALLAGVIVSIVASPNAQADYSFGCGYGYSSNGTTFGYGSSYGYGYVNGTQFGFGYGYQECPISVSTSSLPSGTVGVFYSQALTGVYTTGPATWAVASGSLPTGLSLNSSNGVISGTPTVSNNFTFTVRLTDGNGEIATSGPLSIFIASSSSSSSGGTTTTTTAPTTTTTTPPPPTTTTTTSPLRRLCDLHGTWTVSAFRVIGDALVGKSVVRRITGRCFYAQPRVTSNEPGTTIGVLHDHGNYLIVRIRVAPRSGTGWHILTIRLTNGRACKVHYFVRLP